jgi:hypothetical protein
MLLFYINSILMFYPKICFRKQGYANEIQKYLAIFSKFMDHEVLCECKNKYRP